MSEEMIANCARAIYERRPFNGLDNSGPVPWEAYKAANPRLTAELVEDARAVLSAYNPNERLREALERIVLQRQLGKNADVLADIARSALSPLPQGSR